MCGCVLGELDPSDGAQCMVTQDVTDNPNPSSKLKLKQKQRVQLVLLARRPDLSHVSRRPQRQPRWAGRLAQDLAEPRLYRLRMRIVAVMRRLCRWSGTSW